MLKLWNGLCKTVLQKMNRSLPILIVLLCAQAVYCQQLRNDFGDVYYEPNFYKAKYDAPGGSPYLNDAFTPARIHGAEKTQLVRFNAVEGLVEVMVSEDKVVALDSSREYRIALLDGSNRVYETSRYLDSRGDAQASFFELLDSIGEIRLYLKERKKFFKKEKAQGYAGEKPARFETLPGEFYVTDFKEVSKTLLPLPGKSKTFGAFFGDNEAAVKKFIKEERLKLDDPDDLIKILEFHLAKKL